MSRYSYSSSTLGVTNRLREVQQLLRLARQGRSTGVGWVVGLYERTSVRVAKARGTSGPLENLSGLDIGPGQQLGCLRCFSLKNEMTGIDTDVIARGFSPLDYLRMLRHNTAQ